MMKLATLRNDNGKWRVTDPREGKGVTTCKSYDEANAILEATNEEIVADMLAAKPGKGGKPGIIVKNGKATITAAGLGYKGMLFGGYVADWTALLDYFGASPESQGRRDFESVKDQLCADWKAYADIEAGAILPSGEPKPVGRSGK